MAESAAPSLLLPRRQLLRWAAAAMVLALPLRAHADKPDLKRLYGRIQWVDHFPDYKVKIVEHFADLHVQLVRHFADAPGKWMIVEHFPDFKLQRVEHFPDFTIKWVEHFPGVQ